MFPIKRKIEIGFKYFYCQTFILEAKSEQCITGLMLQYKKEEPM